MPIAFLAQLVCAQQTPWYLPRTGSAIVLIQQGVVSPATRLGWELDLVDQPRNTLVVALHLGTAYAVTMNFWQYVALLGLGYRMQRELGLFWGFDIGAGPAIYGNQLTQRVGPYIEGRLHLGWRVAAVTLSLCGGYGQGIVRVPAPLGGWFIGVLVGWK